MSVLRFSIVGLLMAALLGLAGVGIASGADDGTQGAQMTQEELEKLSLDDLNRIKKAAAKELATVQADVEAYRTRTGGEWPRFWSAYYRAIGFDLASAEKKLTLLQANDQLLFDVIYRKENPDLDPLVDQGDLPVPGWGDTKVKQGPGIGYRIWCVSYGKNTPYEKANGWPTPRWAEDAAQFKVQMDHCQPPNPRPADVTYVVVIRTMTRTPTGGWEVSETTKDVRLQMDSQGNVSTFTKDLPAVAARKN
jgi:hypothetical protein